MKISPYQEQKKEKDRKKANMLYRQGLTLREVGKIIGRSYEWVRYSLKGVDNFKPARTVNNKRQ